MAGSSKNPAASALCVNVSNFVSVKLSGRSNYKIWKTQMLCLINSQKLFYVIDKKGTSEIPDQYDQLVKGWIFGSIDENVLEGFIDLDMAKEVWKKLEELSTIPAKVPSVAAANLQGEVNSTLSGFGNYDKWKKVLVNFIEKNKLLYIIDAHETFPTDENVIGHIPTYDKRVKDKILSCMDTNIKRHFEKLPSARAVWARLEYAFSMPEGPKKANKEAEDAKKI